MMWRDAKFSAAVIVTAVTCDRRDEFDLFGLHRYHEFSGVWFFVVVFVESATFEQL